MYTEENKKLREHPWRNHRSSTAILYGDDGEMQCGHCLLDFKRMSADEIEDRFRQMAMQRLVIEVNLGKDKEESQSLPRTSIHSESTSLLGT